jgi:hypothetical protein
MSTLSGGPNIVTNGLVLYVDAANPKSYVSGSTTWGDLTNSTVSASLTGVGYDVNKKCLLFASSSNSACIFNNSNTMNFNTGSFSIEVTVKLTDTASGLVNTLWQKRNTTTGLGGLPGYQYRVLNGNTTNATTIISVDNGTGNINNTTSFTPTFPYYTFIHSVITFNVSTLKTSEYRNGIQTISEAQNGGAMTGSFYNNNLNFRLGKNDGNSLDAEYYFVRAYNRSLTPSEILQNFNSTRARFGV